MRVHPIERDAAAVDLVKAHKQVDERRLSSTGGTNDGHLLARLRYEAYVVHERLLRVIAKANVLEGDTAAHGLRNGGGHLRVGLNLLLIENIVDALHRRQRALQLVHRERELGERLGRRVDVLEERLQATDGELAAHEEAATNER